MNDPGTLNTNKYSVRCQGGERDARDSGGGGGGGRSRGRGRGGGHMSRQGRGCIIRNGGEAVEGVAGVGSDDGDGGKGSGSGGVGDAGCGTTLVHTQNQKKANKVQVTGACRIWGTMKVTTVPSLKFAIGKFCPTTTLQIKWKTVTDAGGTVKRWWFVAHAPENVLLDLEKVWGQLQLQTG